MRAIYIRTSTEDQEPQNQIRECKSLFEGEYELYQDKQSAWKDNKERESFEKLKEDIKKGIIKELYVWDWDRLFRNRKKLKEFFQFTALYKCKVHSFRQKFFEEFYKIPAPFDDIMQDLFLNLLGWLAEDESNKKSERVRLAIRKVDGVTRSYKGNKWGRKSLKLENKIIALHNQGVKMRDICNQISYTDKNNHKKFVSLGFVHKIIANHKGVKNSI